MPKDYDRMKKALLRTGMPLKEAKRVAAIRTNAKRKKAGQPPAKFHR